MSSTDEAEVIDIDLKVRLRNFKKLGPSRWNFSCDICGDSAHNQRKARFYIGTQTGNNNLVCICHNCGWSGSLKTYLQLQHPDLYQTLQQKAFLHQDHTLFNHDEMVENLPDNILKHVFFMNEPSIERWIDKLKNKKIFLARKSFDKLLLQYRNIRLQQQQKEI